HDEIGQQLTLVKLQLTAGGGNDPRVLAATETVSQLLQQVRDLSLDLRPSMLDDLGLVPTLRWYMERIRRLDALNVSLEVTADFPRLRPDIETLFFRVAQEAVTNVMRHAAATNVSLRVVADREFIRLEVEDDGRGFDPAVASRRALEGGSAGLLGMQERAVFVGAELKLQSSPGAGSRVHLLLPRRLAESGRE